jgi:hypothetical protein
MGNPDSDLCYVVTAEVAAPARVAFDYLADPAKVGEWALGSYNAKPVGGGIYEGTSLLDGSKTLFRTDADARRLLVDYLVGGDAAHLVMRISVRVVPGELLESGPEHCLASMTAWRPAGFDARRWSRLQAFHDAEIHILRERIEAAWSKR